MKRPFALFCGTFITVSLICSIFPIKEAVTLCLSLLVVSLVIGIIQIRKTKKFLVICMGVLLAVSVFVAGYVLTYRKAVSYAGVQHTFLVCTEDKNIVTVSEVDGQKVTPFKMKVYFEKEEDIGKYLLVTGEAEELEKSKELYDDVLYNFSNSVYMQLSLPETENSNGNNVVITSGENLRNVIRQRLLSVLDEDTASKISGILLGDKSGLNITQKNKYSAAGVSHVFAVSGLHLSVLVGMLVVLLRLCRLKKKSVAVTVSVAVIFFMWLVGFTPSVLRSGIMTLILCLSYATNKRPDSLSSLCFAGAVICAGGPFAAADCGFLLSFFAVLAIITVSGYFNSFVFRIFSLFKFNGKTARSLSDMTGTSLAVLFFTLPIIVICFGGSTALSPVTNILVLWTVAPILFLTLCLLVVPVRPIAFVLTLLIRYIDTVVETVVTYDIFGRIFTQKVVLVLLLAASVLLVTCKFFGRKIVNKAVFSFVFLVFVSAVTTLFLRFDGLTVIQTETVGANAVLLVEDEKSLAIIDGDFEFAPENTVYAICDALAEKGIYELDKVIVQNGKNTDVLEKNIDIKETYVIGENDEVELKFCDNTVLARTNDGKMVTHITKDESSFSVFGEYRLKDKYCVPESDVILFAGSFPDPNLIKEKNAKIVVGGKFGDGYSNFDRMKIVEKFLKNSIYTVAGCGKIEIRTTGNGEYAVKTERNKDADK